MFMLRVLCVVIVASLATGCIGTPLQRAPAATGVAGMWLLTVQSPFGTRDTDAVFAQSGEQLSGKLVSPRGEAPLTGTLQGDAISFGVNVNVQGQDVQIDYSGTVSGDTMSGTVQIGSFGEGTWTGKRKAQ